MPGREALVGVSMLGDRVFFEELFRGEDFDGGNLKVIWISGNDAICSRPAGGFDQHGVLIVVV